MRNIEQKLFYWREAEHDPSLRCKHQGQIGQCPYLKLLDDDGNQKADFCVRHGADHSVHCSEQKEANLYRMKLWDQRLKEFGENSKTKTLRDEIGVLRIVLENVMNRCESATDLVLNSNKIAELAVKIEKLVVSCDRLEKSSGALMDKASALTFAGKIVEIISENLNSLSGHVAEELIVSIIDRINEDIIAQLGTL